MKTCRLLFFLCALGCATVIQGAPLITQAIGAYGDSMTMQYSFWLPLASQFNYSVYDNGSQFNWVDQLVKAGYNLGPTATLDGGTYNTYDAGIVGAQSSDVNSTELGVLQPAVSAGSLHVVVEIIGANDFDAGEYQTIYNNAANKSYHPLTDPAVISFENTLFNNIASSVAQTLSENPGQKMILATIPDIGLTPSFKSSFPSSTQRAEVTQVIQAVNAMIIKLAASYHYPVVDMFGLANATQNLTKFGGVSMVDAGGDSGKDLYLSDGFHPGTIAQGVIANTILQADKLAFGDSVTPISEQQIAKWAGLTPNKSTTYYDVNPFVIYTVPEPSTLILAALGGLTLLAWRRNR